MGRPSPFFHRRAVVDVRRMSFRRKVSSHRVTEATARRFRANSGHSPTGGERSMSRRLMMPGMTTRSCSMSVGGIAEARNLKTLQKLSAWHAYNQGRDENADLRSKAREIAAPGLPLRRQAVRAPIDPPSRPARLARRHHEKMTFR